MEKKPAKPQRRAQIKEKKGKDQLHQQKYKASLPTLSQEKSLAGWETSRWKKRRERAGDTSQQNGATNGSWRSDSRKQWKWEEKKSHQKEVQTNQATLQPSRLPLHVGQSEKPKKTCLRIGYVWWVDGHQVSPQEEGPSSVNMATHGMPVKVSTIWCGSAVLKKYPMDWQPWRQQQPQQCAYLMMAASDWARCRKPWTSTQAGLCIYYVHSQWRHVLT